MPHPPWRRLALAALLGLLGLILSPTTGELALETAPRFAPGGAFVLVAFVGLGTGPGLLASLFYSLPWLTQMPALGTPALLLALARVAEAWGTCLLYRRVGSLVFAVALYWITAGLLLDVVLGGLLGLPLDALGLLFVQQLFGGLLNALIGEALLRVPAVTAFLPARDDVRAASLQHYVFSRVVFVATIPALVLAFLFTRTAYEAELGRAESRAARTAQEVRAALRTALLERESALQRLSRQVEMDWAAGRGDAPVRVLALQPAPPGFDDVSFVGADGRVLSRSPGGRRLAETAPRADLGSRQFFREARDGLRPAISPLLFARAGDSSCLRFSWSSRCCVPTAPCGGPSVATFDPRTLASVLGPPRGARRRAGDPAGLGPLGPRVPRTRISRRAHPSGASCPPTPPSARPRAASPGRRPGRRG